jgi:hypothetical protein
MTLSEGKTIKIGSIEFPNVKWRTRIVFAYEDLTGESYYKIGDKIENQFKLFFCAAKIGSSLAGRDFPYSFEQFVALTDDYLLDTINQFTDALFNNKTTEDTKKKLK